MTKDEIEEFIMKFPLYQYEFISSSEIEFSETVRQMCKLSCRHYNTSWSCPPAVGKVEECKEHCMRFEDALIMSTVTKLDGYDHEKETREAKKVHSELTRLIDDKFKNEHYVTYTLASGECRLCARCTFPRDYCRHDKEMYPCVESQGISISQLAEVCGMDYYMENGLLLLFSIIFYKDTGFVD